MGGYAGYILLAAAAGALVPVQALINARIGTTMGGPLAGALINFGVGLIALLALFAVLRVPLPALGGLAALPIWAWFGGIIGAYFVFVAALAVPSLGTAGLSAAIICGQLLSALALDHFGVLNSGHAVTWTRLAGAMLLLVGAYLVLRPDA